MTISPDWGFGMGDGAILRPAPFEGNQAAMLAIVDGYSMYFIVPLHKVVLLYKINSLQGFCTSNN